MEASFPKIKRPFGRVLFGLFFALFVVRVVILPAPLIAASGVPKIISYQGRLTDASGNLLGGSGTTYYFKFSIWNSPTVGSGSRVWPIALPGIATSTLSQGVFNVNIGDTASGYPDALDYDFYTSSDIYLQVEVATSSGGTYETLSPRQRIGAAGSAINAETVNNRIDSAGQGNFATTTISGLTVSGTSTFNGLSAHQLLSFTTATGTALSLTTNGNALTVTNGLTSLQGLTFTNATGTSISLTSSSTLPFLNFTSATGTSVSATNVVATNLQISGITGSTRCLHVDANGVVSGTGGDCGLSSGGNPGGSDGALQFNNNGFFGGDANLTWVSSTQLFTVNGTSSLQSLSFTSASGTNVTTTNLRTTNAIIGSLTGLLKGTNGTVGSALSTDYVSSTVAGAGIVLSGTTGAVTVTNNGVLSFNGATGTITFDSYAPGFITATSTAFVSNSASSSFTGNANNLSDLTNTSTARNNLLGTGTGVQYLNGNGLFVQPSTTNITEGTNLYYTDARARGALSAGAGLTYDSSAGTFTNIGVTSFNGSTGTVTFDPYTAGFVTGTSTAFVANSASSSFTRNANNLSDLTNTSTARSNLGVRAGTGLIFDATNGFVNNGVLSFNGSTGTVTFDPYVPGFITATSTAFVTNSASSSFTRNANNLSDLTNTSTARNNLLGTGTGVQYLNGLGNFIQPSTTNITEGSNLYFTNARARSALSAGTALTYDSANGVFTNNGVTSLTAGTDISISAATGTVTISAQFPSSTYLKAANNLSDLQSTSSARTNIGFSAGTGLTLSAAGVFTNNGVLSWNGATGTVTFDPYTAGFVTGTSTSFVANSASSSFTRNANNLSDLMNTSTARSNLLGIGTGVQYLNGLGLFAQPSTTNITEGTNLYYTDARARGALSAGAGLTYDSSAGTFVNNGVLSLAGTANQVTVSSATGTITLSLPQSIGTSNSPQFTGVTTTNLSFTSATGTSITTSASSTLSFLNFTTATGSTLKTNNLTITGITGTTQCLHVDPNGVVSGTNTECGSGSGTSPGGSNTALQFNNNGSFGGDANLAWTSSTQLFTVNGTSSLQSLSFTSASGTNVTSTNLRTTNAIIGSLSGLLKGTNGTVGTALSTDYVSSTAAGAGITVSGTTGAVTITNNGVLSWNGATGTVTFDPYAAGFVTGTSTAFVANSASSSFTRNANNLSDLTNTSTARSNLLGTGTGVQYLNGNGLFVQPSTTNITEGTNLYYADARARGALSVGTGLTYDSSAGTFTNIGVTSFNGSTGTVTFDPYVPGFITATSTAFIPNAASSSFAKNANNLSDLTNTSTARTNLGVRAGTGLTFDATNGFVNNGVLSNVAGSGITVSSATGTVTITNNGVLSFNGATGTVTFDPYSQGFVTATSTAFAWRANNLSDLNSTSTARSNLLGTSTGVTYLNGLGLFVQPSTTNITEGTNLYYTDARARGALSAGTGLKYDSTNGVFTNNGVTSLVAGTDISVSSATGTVTISNAFASSTYLKVANNLSDLTSTSTARTNIGFSAGTGLTLSTAGVFTNNGVLSWNGATGTVTFDPYTAGFVTGTSTSFVANSASSSFTRNANNLSDLTNTSTARSNLLGIGTGVQYLNGLGLFAQPSTTNITEGTNLYYTDARARGALSAGAGLTYDSSAGTFTNIGVTSFNGSTGTVTFDPYTAGFVTGTSTAFVANSASSSFTRNANNLSDLTNTSTARSNLGVRAGTGLIFDATNGFVNNGVLSNVAGSGITVSSATGTVTITNNGVLSLNGATGTISGLNIYNTTTTLAAGSGITVSNGGVGNTTVTNNGVLSLTAGGNILMSSATGTPTISWNASVATATITNLNFTGATGTTLNVTNVTSTNLNTGTAIIGSLSGLLKGTNGTVGTALSTDYVSSTAAGTGITVSGTTGAVTITNNGVLSLTNGGNINLSSATGTVTLWFNPSLATATITTVTSTLANVTTLNFTNATGTTLTTTNASTSVASTTLEWITATGTPGLYITGTPQWRATTSLVRFGPYDIVGGSASGTVLGANYITSTGQDFINFQVNSSSLFKVDTGGGLTIAASSTLTNINFTNATGTSISLSGSSTLANLNFTNATGTTLNWVTATGTNLKVTNFTLGSVNGLLRATNGSVGAAASNEYVSSTSCGAGLTCTATTGAITIANNGVLSLTGAGNINVSSATGTVTLWLNTALSTSTITTVTSTLANLTGINFTTATGSNISVSGSSTIAGLNFVNATGTNLNTSNAVIGSLTGLLKGTNGTIGTAASTDYVSSTAAGAGITVNQSTGAVTVTNNGVLSLTAGGNILVSSATGTPTISWNASVATATITTATTTNLNFTNATGTSISLSGSSTLANLNFTNATGTTLNWVTATGTNLKVTNFTLGSTNGILRATNGVVGAAASNEYVSSTSCGAGLTCTATTGAITIANNGVLSLAGAGNINVSSTTGTVTLWLNTAISTSTITTVTSTLANLTGINFTTATGSNISVSGSSTIAGLNFVNATGTTINVVNATATNLNATNATIGSLTVSSCIGCGAGPGSSPGGSDTNIQFNNGDTFGGDANFIWTSSTQLLTVNGTSTVNGLLNVDMGGGGTTSILPGTVASFSGSSTQYLQLNIQNRSASTSASTDFIATANDGTDSTFYIDMGINSSNYNQAQYSIGGAHDGYLYTSDGGLAIGTASSSANAILKFHTGTSTAAGERMRIDSSGNVAIGTTTTNFFFTIGSSTANDFITVTRGGAITLSTTTVSSLTLGSVNGILRATNGSIGAAASNEYVSSTSCGAGLTCSATTGAVTVTNNGVLSLTAGGNINVSSATGTPTISWNASVATATITNLNFTAATGTVINVANTTTTALTSGFTVLNGSTTFNPGAPNGVLFNLGSSSQVQFIATSSPKVDMALFSNAGQGVNTAGVSAIQVTYVGGTTASIESSAQRIDLTPGNGASSVWNGLRLTGTTTASTTEIQNALKIDTFPSGVSSGTDRAIFIGSGWDQGLSINGGGATQAILVTASSSPTVDMVTIGNDINSSTTSAGVSALQLNYRGGAAAVEASAQRIDFTPGTTSGGTWNGLRIVASTTASGVVLNGLKLDTVVPGAGTENALFFGTGWDTAFNFSDTTTTIQFANSTGSIIKFTNGSTTLVDIKAMGNNNHPFGAAVTAGAFISRNSYFGEEFQRFRPGTCTASSTLGRGDYGQSNAPSASGCSAYSGELSLTTRIAGTGAINGILSSTTAVNGVEEFSLNGGNTDAEANEFIGQTTTTAIGMFAAANLPVIQMKVKVSAFANTSRVALGISDMVVATTTVPNNGIYFTNCTTPSTCGTTLVGVVKNGTTYSSTTCTNALTANKWALLRIEVRATNDVHFFINNDTASGGVETECGTGVTGTAPSGGLTMTMNFSQQANATQIMDIDYFRVWQDDNDSTPNMAWYSSSTPELLATTTPDLSAASGLTEIFKSDIPIQNGTLVALDPNGGGKIKPTDSAYDPDILGVVVGDAGLSIDNGLSAEADSIRVATHGRAIVNASAENGSIEAGDYLAASHAPGVAMKADRASRVIGRALNGYAGSGVGVVVVEIAPFSYNGPSLTSLLDGVSIAPSDMSGFGKQVLAALLVKQGQDALFGASTTPSEMLVDRLAAGIEMISPSVITQGLTVDTISALNDATTFKNDVIFFGRPYFTTDTAGFAVVKSGAKSVDVTFSNDYLEQPIVNATISLEAGDSADAIFGNNVQYAIVNKTAHGFTIVLNKSAPQDIRFSWTVFAVKGAKTFFSAVVSNDNSGTPAPTDTGTNSDTSGSSAQTDASTTTIDSTSSDGVVTTPTTTTEGVPTDTTTTNSDSSSSTTSDTPLPADTSATDSSLITP